MTVELSGLYYSLEGRRSHWFMLFERGSGAAALVDSRETCAQLVRTVLGWLPARAQPVKLDDGQFVFTQAVETLHNRYAVRPSSEGLVVRSGSANTPVGPWRWAFGERRYTPLAWPAPISVATATEAELRLLPSITALRARRIIEYRATVGHFTVESLRAVSGLGPKVCAAIAPWVVDSAPNSNESA